MRKRSQWEQLTDGSCGLIFIPTNEPPEIEEHVQLDLIFTEGPRFALHGVVVLLRRKGDARMKAGVGLRVSSACMQTWAFINDWTQGVARDRRELRRLPVRLLVIYRANGQRRVSLTENLSPKGLRIRCFRHLQPGTEIRLQMSSADLSDRIDLRGVVVYGDPRIGIGVQLLFEDTAVQVRYRGFFEDLEDQHLRRRLRGTRASFLSLARQGVAAEAPPAPPGARRS